MIFYTKEELQATFKSMDTEEWLDIHYTRPFGLMWAKFFNIFDIHPNVVTILGIFIGFFSGIALFMQDFDPAHKWWWAILSILLLNWANFYDNADGVLARMTGKKTLWGRILDGFASDVWFFSIYVCIALRLTLYHEWGIWSWVLGSLAGFICHTKQCQLSDYYRNIHLFFIKGKAGSELDNYAQMRQEYLSTPWSGHLAWKVFLYFYCNYCRAQEQMTPQFQRFYTQMRKTYGDSIPERLKQDFRNGSLPLMKYTNILTHNTRAIVLFLSIIASCVWDVRYDLVWIYPAFEIIVLTILWAYMRYRHEALSKRLYLHINDYK